MPKLTLEALELVDAIDRGGSFSAAAELLNRVPSTVSYGVAKVEEELGVSLFRRNGPRIEITDAGRELLREGRLLLQAAGELERRVKRVASGWESELRIAIDSIIGAETLAPLVAAFDATPGATTLRLATDTLTGAWEALVDQRADLVLAPGAGPAGGGYRAVEVARLDFAYCVAPFHPLARAAAPVAEAALRAHRAVVVADSARRLPLRSTGFLSGQQMVVVPTMQAKLRLQAEGLGAGYLPLAYADPAVARGMLVKLDLENPRAAETLSLAWRVGESGKALEWWSQRLGEPAAIGGLLASAGRAAVAAAGGATAA